MNRLALIPTIFVATYVVVTSTGCERKPPSAAVPSAAVPAQPTPESSFDLIVETFRRGVEEIPIGFVVQDSSGGQTMMTGKNIVTHTLLLPEKEGDALRAEIKVTSDTQYSLQRSTEKPGDADSDQSAGAAEGSTGAGSDVEILDPAVASAPGGAERRTTTGKVDTNAVTVAREASNYERTYELVYEGGRWRLVTKLDPKTEESIQIAFDRALESQS